MSRDGAGNYTLPVGNPVVSGTVIQSVWANNTLDDVAVALTNSLSRTGQGGMLAPFYFANGTEQNPSASFTDDQTSGLYRAATSDIRMSISGNDVMRWIRPSDGVPQISLPNASGFSVWASILTDGAGIDTVVPIGTSTGQTLRWDDTSDPANPVWQATTSLLVDDDGNVGIGTNDPDSLLHVGDSNQQSGYVELTLGGVTGFRQALISKGYDYDVDKSALTIQSSTGGSQSPIRFVQDVNDVPSMTIASDGNVGIGIDSPNEKLQVEGDIKIASGTGFGVLHFGDTSDQTKITGRDDTHATLPDTLDFYTNGANRVRLDAAGIFNVYAGFRSSGAGNNSFRAGFRAGNSSQGAAAVAIGIDTGATSQGNNAIAIGNTAATTSQGAQAVAIGLFAGETSQGSGAIAIGWRAGETSQHASSIILSSKGSTPVNSTEVGQIKIQSPTAYLLTSGADWIHTGSMTTGSDIRLKTDVEPITGAVSKVQELNGVTFKYTDENATDRATGLIAQDVQKVLPEAVIEGADGYLGVGYGNMVGLLVEAIKEQQKTIADLSARLSILESNLIRD